MYIRSVSCKKSALDDNKSIWGHPYGYWTWYSVRVRRVITRAHDINWGRSFEYLGYKT